MNSPPRRAMFVSADGFHEALGRSQVYPYLHGLAQHGHFIDLITFEKSDIKPRFREHVEERFRWTSIRHFSKRYAPLNVVEGNATVAAVALAARTNLLHARAFNSAMMLLPAVLAQLPLLMDTRGFWFDEKADVGSLPRDGRLYPITKKIENALYTHSSAITVLTCAAREYLRGQHPHRREIRAPIHVIPTCVDLELFRLGIAPDPELASELRGRKALVYAGSLGTFYMEREMVEFYAAYRNSRGAETALLLLTPSDPAPVERELRALGLGADLVVRKAKRAEMPGFIAAAEAALSFIRPTFSKIASAPTKVGEYLACGLPVAANDVGDMRRVIVPAVGAIVDFGTSLREQAHAFAQRVAAREFSTAACAEQAKLWFSLERAIAAYASIYAAMPARRGALCPLADNTWP